MSLALALLWALASRPDELGPTRLAIMPFELQWEDGGGNPERRPAEISEWLLAETATRWQGRLEVVGPRSTARYSGSPFPDLRRLGSELRIDYVLHARPLAVEDAEPELLVELIRLPDGAHVFVERFAAGVPSGQIEHVVRDGLARALGLPAPSP